MTGLFDALLLDAVLVTAAGIALVTAPQARLAHPGVIYLGFHLYVVSFRGWAIYGGAFTFLGVDPAAVARAVGMADAFLVAATLGWLAVRKPSDQRRAIEWPMLQERQVVWIAVVSVPLGIISLLSAGYVPGIGEGSTVVTTSYQVIAVMWPALALVALTYGRGFRPVLLFPLVVYLIVLSVQGHSRFRVIIPLVMLLFIYLDRQGRRWPPIRFVAAAAVVLAVFIPLKDIGTSVRASEADFGTVLSTIEGSAREAVAGTSPEQALLDQAAITVVLADQSARPFMGRPYLALLTLPVPRPWWPGKPGLAEHLSEISTPRYPLATVGAVTSLPGDMYLNFRWWGLVVGGFLFGVITGTVFRRAYAAPQLSVARFLYVLLAASLIQVSRDGLISVVLFTVVNAMPWVAMAFFSYRQNVTRPRHVNPPRQRTGRTH